MQAPLMPGPPQSQVQAVFSLYLHSLYLGPLHRATLQLFPFQTSRQCLPRLKANPRSSHTHSGGAKRNNYDLKQQTPLAPKHNPTTYHPSQSPAAATTAASSRRCHFLPVSPQPKRGRKEATEEGRHRASQHSAATSSAAALRASPRLLSHRAGPHTRTPHTGTPTAPHPLRPSS